VPETSNERSTDAPRAGSADLFTTLAGEPYLSLTTYRRSGVPVPTPVWAAPDGSTLVVWTGANSGKVKRLRHTPRVAVAPCDRKGRLLGDPTPATARILGPADMPRVKAAMRAKYGWQFSVSAFGTTVGRLLRIAPHGQVGIEVTLG
jgi:PPOX class probable F420-dependent enzyme